MKLHQVNLHLSLYNQQLKQTQTNLKAQITENNQQLKQIAQLHKQRGSLSVVNWDLQSTIYMYFSENLRTHWLNVFIAIIDANNGVWLLSSLPDDIHAHERKRNQEVHSSFNDNLNLSYFPCVDANKNRCNSSCNETKSFLSLLGAFGVATHGRCQ